MEKFSLRAINKQAHRYRVDVYKDGGIGEYSTKEFKTYKGASAYAVRQSLLYSSGRVELIDIETDRDYYVEDNAASQEYINGSLERDGLGLQLRDRIICNTIEL